MNDKKILQLINKLENKYPVTYLHYKEMHIWPILRVYISFEIVRLRNNRQFKNKGIINNLKHTLGLIYNIFKSVKEICIISKNTMQNRPYILSDNVYFFKIEDQYFDRVCGPYVFNLSKDGNKFTYCYRNGEHKKKRKKMFQPIPIQFIVDWIQLKIHLFQKNKKFENLKDIKEILKYINDLIPGSNISLKNFLNNVLLTYNLSNYFEKKLTKNKNNVALLADYYNTSGWALTYACHKLNIPSVDIQHGVQSNIHIAYAKWNNVPKTGYNTIPTHFFCWSQIEKKSIDKWSYNLDTHKPIVVGNRLVKYWKDGNSKFIKIENKKINSIINKYKGKKHILYTMQDTVPDKELVNIIKRTQDNYVWWIRYHPNWKQVGNTFKNQLIKKNLNNIVINEANDLPLYSILGNINIHVTKNSSVTLEAQSFDIPSVVLDDDAKEYYANEIESGMVYYSSINNLTMTIKQVLANTQTQFHKADDTALKLPINYYLNKIINNEK